MNDSIRTTNRLRRDNEKASPVFAGICLFFAFLALFFAASSHADEVCDSIAGIAATVMTARQNGADMAPLVAAIRGVEGSDSEKRVALEIIADAFSEPMYTTPAIRERAISEFRNKWYLVCFRSRT